MVGLPMSVQTWVQELDKSQMVHRIQNVVNSLQMHHTVVFLSLHVEISLYPNMKVSIELSALPNDDCTMLIPHWSESTPDSFEEWTRSSAFQADTNSHWGNWRVIKPRWKGHNNLLPSDMVWKRKGKRGALLSIHQTQGCFTQTRKMSIPNWILLWCTELDLKRAGHMRV